MERFRKGDLHLLVATSVVEVGVDVPNASVMLVENAERFGLAQLHQLRGRIGRGAHKSYCILQGRPPTSREAWQRLKVMERTLDGFVIAEEDFHASAAWAISWAVSKAAPWCCGPVIRCAIKLCWKAPARRPFVSSSRIPVWRNPSTPTLRHRARALYKSASHVRQGRLSKSPDVIFISKH
jgi:hypothetical protein